MQQTLLQTPASKRFQIKALNFIVNLLLLLLFVGVIWAVMDNLYTVADGEDGNNGYEDEDDEMDDDENDYEKDYEKDNNLYRVAEREDKAENVPAQLWFLLPANLINLSSKEWQHKPSRNYSNPTAKIIASSSIQFPSPLHPYRYSCVRDAHDHHQNQPDYDDIGDLVEV